MNKRHAEIFTAAVITAVLLIACFAADRFMPETPEEPTGETIAELRLRSGETVDMKIMETPAPAPTPNPLPPDAADIYVDDSTVLFTLSSADEARQVLLDYLKTGETSIPEEEHLVSVSFEKKIRVIPATGTCPLSTAEEVLATLKEDPALIPLRVITEARTYKTDKAGQKKDKLEALEKGKRYYKQIAADGLSLTLTEKTYSAGELIDSFVTEQEVLSERKDGLVLTGTFKGDSGKGEPDKKQGPKGKDAAGLKLSLPIRVAISSYFGFRNGEFHRGIDFPAKAGASIKTPAEGVVIYAGERGEYGKVVEIDHGNGFVSRLAHCDTITVVLNQRVFDGEVVATLADVEEEPVLLLPDPTPTPVPEEGAEPPEEPEEEQKAELPHLHYELLIDGIPYNPLYYLG